MAEQTGAGSSEGSPIIVDSDWKSQAMAEKERLAEAEAKSSGGKASARGAGPAGAEELPPADFSTLVGMLATQAVMSLGGMADRKSGAMIFDPEMARLYIDLLAVIEEKTKGNVTQAEEQDLKMTLNELRLRYVELSKAVAAQAARGGPLQPGGVAAAVPTSAPGEGVAGAGQQSPRIRVG